VLDQEGVVPAIAVQTVIDHLTSGHPSRCRHALELCRRVQPVGREREQQEPRARSSERGLE
jgi:hypothetical protein